MTSETQTLTAEMEKLSDRISNDLLSTLVNLSGSLKDIDNGTHIRIPMDVGYVNFYKSAERWKLSCWLVQEMTETEVKETNEMNYDDES